MIYVAEVCGDESKTLATLYGRQILGSASVLSIATTATLKLPEEVC